MAELRILSQFRHLSVSGVSPLEDSLSSSVPLVTLPDKVLSKRLGELGSKHVSASGARRKGGWVNVGGSYYWPCSHLKTTQE